LILIKGNLAFVIIVFQRNKDPEAGCKVQEGKAKQQEEKQLAQAILDPEVVAHI